MQEQQGLAGETDNRRVNLAENHALLAPYLPKQYSLLAVRTYIQSLPIAGVA